MPSPYFLYKGSHGLIIMLSNLRNELDLIQRHLEVLRRVIDNEPIGIIKLSELSNMPQHKVRYSLRVLEHHGIIQPSPQGAISTKKAKEFLKSFPKELASLKKEMESLANKF